VFAVLFTPNSDVNIPRYILSSYTRTMPRREAIAFPVDPSQASIFVGTTGDAVMRKPAGMAREYLENGRLVWCGTTRRQMMLVESSLGGEKDVCVVVPAAPGWAPFDKEQYRYVSPSNSFVCLGNPALTYQFWGICNISNTSSAKSLPASWTTSRC
jgi:hypothetical protein